MNSENVLSWRIGGRSYGGNSFCLRYEMRRSGFDTAIRKLLESGVIYGGESADAIVAGSTLKGTEVADLPEAADTLVRDGLGLVDKVDKALMTEHFVIL